MRFGVQDLLVATTVVSIYCVALTLAPTGSWTWLDVGLAATPGGILLPLGAWWLVTHRRIGRVAVWFRAPRSWQVHFWFAGLAFVMACWLHWREIPFPKPVLGQFVAMHVMFGGIFLSGVRFGEHGAAFGPAFMSWSDYRFDLEGRQLHWRRAGGSLQHPVRGKIAVPADACDAIREVLAEHQVDDET